MSADSKQIRSFLNNKDSNLRLVGLQMIKKSSNKDEFFNDLLMLLNDENPDVRSFVVEILSEMKNKDPYPSIIKLITDSNKNVRLSVLEALIKNPSEDYIDNISPLIKDHEIAVRRAALRALGSISSPRILDVVIKGVSDSNESIIREAETILSSFNGMVSASFIRDYLHHPDDAIRAALIDYLVSKVDTDPLSFYVEALKDEVAEIRALSLYKLRDFIQHSTVIEKFSSIVPDVLAMLSDSSKEVRFQAIKTLEILKDPSTIEHLIDIATNDPDENIRTLAMETIVSIRRALRLD